MFIQFRAVAKSIGRLSPPVLAGILALSAAPHAAPPPAPDAQPRRLFQSLRAEYGITLWIAPGLDDPPLPLDNRDGLWTLLADYNYLAIAETPGRIGRVIVSSLKQPHGGDPDAAEPAQGSSPGRLFDYADEHGTPPDAYPDPPPGPVFGINLPTEALGKMAPGEAIALDLPTGHFQVVYENRAEEPNGNLAWYGRLSGNGGSYWVILSFGPAGDSGRIETPAGVYRIESRRGQGWLIGGDG